MRFNAPPRNKRTIRKNPKSGNIGGGLSNRTQRIKRIQDASIMRRQLLENKKNTTRINKIKVNFIERKHLNETVLKSLIPDMTIYNEKFTQLVNVQQKIMIQNGIKNYSSTNKTNIFNRRRDLFTFLKINEKFFNELMELDKQFFKDFYKLFEEYKFCDSNYPNNYKIIFGKLEELKKKQKEFQENNSNLINGITYIMFSIALNHRDPNIEKFKKEHGEYIIQKGFLFLLLDIDNITHNLCKDYTKVLQYNPTTNELKQKLKDGISLKPIPDEEEFSEEEKEVLDQLEKLRELKDNYDYKINELRTIQSKKPDSTKINDIEIAIKQIEKEHKELSNQFFYGLSSEEKINRNNFIQNIKKNKKNLLRKKYPDLSIYFMFNPFLKKLGNNTNNKLSPIYEDDLEDFLLLNAEQIEYDDEDAEHGREETDNLLKIHDEKLDILSNRKKNELEASQLQNISARLKNSRVTRKTQTSSRKTQKV